MTHRIRRGPIRKTAALRAALRALAIAAAVAGGVSEVIAAPPHWESIGPPDDGITSLHYDGNSDVLFAGTWEGFWYLDIASGVWTQREDVGWIGRTVWAVATHPMIPGWIVTGRENAFFKGYLELSTDWGETPEGGYNSQGGRVTDVRSVPGRSDVFLACTWSDIAPGELLRTTDGGYQWALLTGHGQYAMTELAIDPSDPMTVYLAGSSRVTKTTDGGVTWYSASDGLREGLGVYAVSIGPGDPDLLLASNDDGVFRTTDGGGWWEPIPGLPTFQRFAFDPADPERVAGITFSPYRVHLSEDAGTTWRDMTGDYAGSAMADLVFSADGRALYVASSMDGVFRTVFRSVTVGPPVKAVPSRTTPIAAEPTRPPGGRPAGAVPAR
jgi:photosystem II stability/assembly factor-like uncharacterized protein